MEKCKYYHENDRIIGWLGPDEVIKKKLCVCGGTKNQETCTCGGDRTKCDFYSYVRENARKDNECHC